MVYVIIPVYNAERYIIRCLDSVFSNQEDKVVVCIDDGSTDLSFELVNNFAKSHQELVLLKQENKGPSAARNYGLNYIEKMANDEDFLFFIDADDYIDKNYFSTLIKMSQVNKCDIVCSTCVYKGENSEKHINQVDSDSILSSIDATCLLLEDRTIQSHSHSKIYKFKTWKGIRYPENIVSMEDQATIYKTFLNSNNVFITNYAGYYYWQDGESICRSKLTNKKILDSLNGYYSSVDFFKVKKDKVDANLCFQSAINGFSACFLMLYPRLINDNSKYLEEIKTFAKIVRKKKIISKYKPVQKKEKIKKILYLVNEKFYSKVYRCVIKYER